MRKEESGHTYSLRAENRQANREQDNSHKHSLGGGKTGRHEKEVNRHRFHKMRGKKHTLTWKEEIRHTQTGTWNKTDTKER